MEDAHCDCAESHPLLGARVLYRAYRGRQLDECGWVGLLLWIGLSAVQWLGSIMWENVPVKMAAIHAGDWLVKLVLIAGIVGVWR